MWILGSYASLNFLSCSEVDEIYKICSVIGSPNQNSWAEGLKLAENMNYEFPQVVFCFLLPTAELACCFFVLSFIFA